MTDETQHTGPSPMTVRFTDEEHEFLRLLATWWVSQSKIPRPDKVAALRKMLRMVKPPTENTPLAKELRAAHEKMISS